MKNPFPYGEIVTGDDFADRKQEQEELLKDLKEGGRVFLISPRRYGKTSLIINVLETLKQEGIYVAYLDLYRASSLTQFLELYAKTVTDAAETALGKMVKTVKEVLPGMRPKIELNPDGTTTLSIDYTVVEKDALKLLDEVYDAPEKIAIKRKKKFVVAFDEFQEIRSFNGDRIEKAMRASFQHHHNTAYLFAGSKRHMLFEMVQNQARAFYKLGKVINLQKLPRNEFIPFLVNKFKQTGFALEDGVIEKILDIAEEYPYNVQFICHELWSHLSGSRKIKIEDVSTILKMALSHLSPTYVSLWDGLSLHQRRILKAIAFSGGRNVFSQNFAFSNKLGSISSIQTSVKLLTKKEILDKEGDEYFIMDVFFKEWIRWKMG